MRSRSSTFTIERTAAATYCAERWIREQQRGSPCAAARAIASKSARKRCGSPEGSASARLPPAVDDGPGLEFWEVGADAAHPRMRELLPEGASAALRELHLHVTHRVPAGLADLRRARDRVP